MPAGLSAKEFNSKQELLELCDYQDNECRADVDSLDLNVFDEEIEPAKEVLSDENKQKLWKLEPKLKLVDSYDILMIYNRIRNALASDIEVLRQEFGIVYQLNLLKE